jgi:arabinogalactan oligomer/maltooligosaccharide transport system substrate-binding protein
MNVILKKLLIMLSATCLLLTSSFGLAADKLVVWHAYRGAEKTAFEKVIGMYNKKMASKGLQVKSLAIPYDAYADKISAAVPRGKGPDVFIFAQDRLGGWVEAGNTVEPIDFFMDDATRERFLPGMLDAMTYQDSIYGLPLNYKSITLIYNKALIKQPPKTSGEMVKLAKQHTDVTSGRYGLVYFYNNFYFHAALMNAYGGRVFDENGQLVLNSPQTVASMEEMMKWYKKDGIMPAEPGEALVSSMFNEGKAAMIFNGPWALGEISKDIDYGLAKLPSLDEIGGKPMRPWLTIEGVYVSAGSKNKEQAYDFANYLASPEVGVILALEGRQLNANKAVYDNPEVANDEILKAFRAQLDDADPMPNRAEMTMVWSPATTAMNKIVKGSSSAEEAIAEAQQTIEASIKALRKSR